MIHFDDHIFQMGWNHQLLGSPAESDRNYLVSWGVSPTSGTYIQPT